MMAFLYLLGAFLAAFAFVFPVFMFWFRDSLLDSIIGTLLALGFVIFLLIMASSFYYFITLFMGEING
ncbi:hypothetical protein [Parasutterella sp.]|jgi:hypothetical protein|uniref:hypothetical protein n=1 Tax=Parasutterella sp. TaxID=2049037 RepID=UPI00351FC92E